VSHGFTGWRLETMTFTATTTGSEVLNFLALGYPNGVPPIVMLDGVSFSSAVPEPSTVSMLVIGVLGLGAARLRRRLLTAAV